MTFEVGRFGDGAGEGPFGHSLASASVSYAEPGTVGVGGRGYRITWMHCWVGAVPVVRTCVDSAWTRSGVGTFSRGNATFPVGN